MGDAERPGPSRGRSARRRGLAAWLALGLAGAGIAAAQTAPVVTLAPEVQKGLAITTQPLTAVRHAAEVDAFAKVLDPGPLAQLESDYETAEAAAAASKAEAARSKALHEAGGSVAAKDVEASQSQARADALKLQLLRQQFDLQWGPGVGRLSEAARRRLVAGLAKGRLALVHVDTHNNDGQADARRVRIDIGTTSVTGVVIGPARVAEPRLQSSGLIVEVAGPSAMLLSVGLTQSAHIEQTGSENGVRIPRTAVIRFRGLDWAYVRVSPTSFQRRPMLDPTPEDSGFFVAKGFAAGDEVVTQGAAGLFAADVSRAGGSD